MRLLTVVGARPQFIKAAPVSAVLRSRADLRVAERIVHTGQHHDPELSDAIIAELGLPRPDIRLAVHGGSHADMLGRMLLALDPVLAAERPDAVMVYGDTNSTLAGALAAAQRDIPVVHVEAGLRSHDPRMPEERNRVLTDRLASVCFCTSDGPAQQLRHEGITTGVYVVGDVMQDALLAVRDRGASADGPLGRHALVAGDYVLATIHRAENTDDADRLSGIADGLSTLGVQVVLPLHPRTRAALAAGGIALGANVLVLPPQGYADVVALTARARCVVTDSGGLQKEAYWLGVPCVTVRTSTEWTETVSTGWNRLCDASGDSIHAAVRAALPPASRPPIYGAPGAATRIAELLPSALG